MGPGARIVIPAAFREAMEAEEGDTLVAAVDGDGVVRLTSASAALRMARRIVRDAIPADVSLSESLIEDRASAGRTLGAYPLRLEAFPLNSPPSVLGGRLPRFPESSFRPQRRRARSGEIFQPQSRGSVCDGYLRSTSLRSAPVDMTNGERTAFRRARLAASREARIRASAVRRRLPARPRPSSSAG